MILSCSKNLNNLFCVILLSLIPAYPPPLIRAQLPETSTPNPSQKLSIKDELYFGLTQPGGGTLSEQEWQQFLNKVITPRFQEGLTVLDAYGQYLNRAGILTQEKSKLVILIHENSPEQTQAIAEIIDAYKRTFNQESVLRVTSEVKASF